MAQGRFTESLNALDVFLPKNEGNDVMVPLTQSMFVPGKTGKMGKVIVEIGTGYYVEKPIPAAKEFLKRKVEYTSGNASRLEEIISVKRNNLESIMLVMTQRVRVQQARENAAL